MSIEVKFAGNKKVNAEIDGFTVQTDQPVQVELDILQVAGIARVPTTVQTAARLQEEAVARVGMISAGRAQALRWWQVQILLGPTQLIPRVLQKGFLAEVAEQEILRVNVDTISLHRPQRFFSAE